MTMCMRALIVGAAIGIPAATISPTQAGMIGPGKLQITEPASLAEPVRARVGSGVSPGSTVRSGGGLAYGGGSRPSPSRGVVVNSQALKLKAVQVRPKGHWCHHGGCGTGGGQWCRHGGCGK
jgi:hypothetical protein